MSRIKNVTIRGAQEKTRTSTSLRLLVPETSASTIPPPGLYADFIMYPPCELMSSQESVVGVEKYELFIRSDHVFVS